MPTLAVIIIIAIALSPMLRKMLLSTIVWGLKGFAKRKPSE